jgi:hypothetical protein
VSGVRVRSGGVRGESRRITRQCSGPEPRVYFPLPDSCWGAAPAADRPHVMRRRLFHLITVVSLMLCVAMLGLCVRSAGHYDRVDYTWVSQPPILRRTCILTSNTGQCSFNLVTFDLKQIPANPGRVGWELQSAVRSTSPMLMYPPYRDSFFFAKFAFSHRPWTATTLFGSPSSFTDWAVAFPVWAPVVLFGAMPAVRGVLWLRKRTATRSGHCRVCGYDLRATPGRCPECGAESSVNPAAA